MSGDKIRTNKRGAMVARKALKKSIKASGIVKNVSKIIITKWYT